MAAPKFNLNGITGVLGVFLLGNAFALFIATIIVIALVNIFVAFYIYIGGCVFYIIAMVFMLINGLLSKEKGQPSPGFLAIFIITTILMVVAFL